MPPSSNDRGPLSFDLMLQNSVENVDEIAPEWLPFEIQHRLVDLTAIGEIASSDESYEIFGGALEY